MRCSQFMDPPGRTSRLGKFIDRIFDKVVRLYSRALVVVLNHRVLTLVLSGIFFLGTFAIVKLLPTEFIPSQDTSGFMIRVKTPDGSSLEFTNGVTKQVEQWLLSKKEVKRYFSSVGGFGGSESSTANLFVTLHDKKDRPVDSKTGEPPRQQDLLVKYRGETAKLVKGGKVMIQDTSQQGFSASGRGYPVEFTLTGPEWAGLGKTVKAVMADMQASGLYTDVDTDYKDSVKEVHIIPNRDAAKRYGVSVQEIGNTINALVGSVVVGKFSKDGHRNDIRVKMLDVNANEAETLKNVYVRNTRGELVRLLEVARVEVRPGTQSVTRKDRSRAINVFAGVAPGTSQGKALDHVKVITAKHLGEGQKLIESGSAETFREAFRSFIFALILGIVIAYMVLGSQFNSFIDPLVVLVAMPFAFSGAFLGLWLMGMSLNMYSMIGLILLMGIVKKNSILLVEFTAQRREEGLELRAALEDACPKRVRPILMTSLSTVAGAVPLAVSLGPGSEALGPMAIAVIGGSIVSTFLTLLVVPPLYSVLSPNKHHKESDDQELAPELA
jgi:HAE1 family hydrophobic/amphiphilic exporter-1